MGAKRAQAHSNSRGKGTGLGGRGAEAHLLSFAMLLFTLANHALKLASMAASTSGRCSARSWSSATSVLRSYSCGLEQLKVACADWHEMPPTASFHWPQRYA